MAAPPFGNVTELGLNVRLPVINVNPQAKSNWAYMLEALTSEGADGRRAGDWGTIPILAAKEARIPPCGMSRPWQESES